MQWQIFKWQKASVLPSDLEILKNVIGMHSYTLGMLLMWTRQGVQEQCVFLHGTLKYTRIFFQRKFYPAHMIWPVSNLQGFLLFPFFFFFLLSKTNQSFQVFWSLCLPTGSTGFVSGPGGGTVVNALWLTASHFPDSGSDWSSPCSSHMAAEYSSLHPFLVLSPTVPFCCTQHWEWVPGFVSGFWFTPVRQ